jgi:hydroxypyruvate isomerase
VIRFSAHVSMLFADRPPLERPAAAREAGFELVETWWPGEGWAEAVRAAGVGVSCLNADGGSIPDGERGFLNVPERAAESLAAVESALALAREVGSPVVNVLVGRALPDVPRRRQLDTALALLRDAASLAGAAGVTIVLEPINEVDIPGSLLPTARAAADAIEAIGSPSVRLLFDAYHSAASGADPLREVREVAAVLGHVQYADHPGRGAPGSGTIDLDALVATLGELGYEGAVGLEYVSGRS